MLDLESIENKCIVTDDSSNTLAWPRGICGPGYGA